MFPSAMIQTTDAIDFSLRNQNNLATHPALFQIGMRLCRVRQRHHAFNRQLELTRLDGLGVTNIRRWIGMRHDGVDLHGGVKGSILRRAEDAAETTTLLYLGEQFGRSVAANGIRDAIDEAQTCERIIVIDRNRFDYSRESLSLIELLFTDTGKHLRSKLFRGVHRATADTAQRSGDENGLTRLRFGTVRDDLISCD